MVCVYVCFVLVSVGLRYGALGGCWPAVIDLSVAG